jgi:hypothetical protein
VANALGGVSISDNTATGIFLEGDFSGGEPSHSEGIVFSVDLTTGVSLMSFQERNAGVLTNHWFCSPIVNISCQGTVTVNRSAGTAVFSGVVVPSSSEFTAPSITLNGTLTFTPF